MTIARTRRQLYTAARILGDVQAVKRGRIGQRLLNRILGRTMARAMRGVWR